MQKGDIVMIGIIFVIFVVWLIGRFRRYLKTPRMGTAPLPITGKVVRCDETDLLEQFGYEVVSGKSKVPISITVNEQDELHSRLFIDYVARQHGDWYVVKTARARKPLELTGSSLRDQFLMYQLIFSEAAGILYVDTDERTIKKIRFTLDE